MKTAFVLALVASAGAASASIQTTTDIGEYRINRATGAVVAADFNDRVVNQVYANWQAPSTLQGVLTTGLNRLDGDDTFLSAANGAGWLDDMGFSLANTNAAGSTARITGFSATIQFFDNVTLTNLGGFTSSSSLTSLSGGGLAAQSSVRLSFGAGSLKSLNIFLPRNIITTVTITAVTFGAGTGNNSSLVGQQVRNAPATGTSTDSVILNGSVVPSPFGGNPAGNFSFFINTDNIPTPGSLALLGLAGIAAGRRRR